VGIGVYLPISHPGGLPAPGHVLDYAREAERLGFDALWVGDHLLWRTPLLEATTTLAAVAAVTSRIALGTNIFLLGLRPALLVGALALFPSWCWLYFSPARSLRTMPAAPGDPG